MPFEGRFPLLRLYPKHWHFVITFALSFHSGKHLRRSLSLEQEFDLSRYRSLMESAITALKSEFSGLRTGRASTALVDRIQVNSYGSRMSLNQVATVSVPEPRMLLIQVWDRGLSDAVARAISESDLGLNPIAEGTMIRVPIPELSEERRVEMVKVAHKYAEQTRVAIRRVRRDCMENLKSLQKSGKISEDEHRVFSVKVQDLTDKFVQSVDVSLSEKEAEIKRV